MTPVVWPGFTPDTLRDAAAVLARAARNFHDHPDTVPDDWPATAEWPTDIRHRAARLADLAAFLATVADDRGDL